MVSSRNEEMVELLHVIYLPLGGPIIVSSMMIVLADEDVLRTRKIPLSVELERDDGRSL